MMMMIHLRRLMCLQEICGVYNFNLQRIFVAKYRALPYCERCKHSIGDVVENIFLTQFLVVTN